MSWHRAVIHWEEDAVRGRHDLPPTLRYIGLSRFDEDVTWPDGAWSVECRFDVPPPEQPDSRVSAAEVRFLVDRAPIERLHGGVRFGLFEGLTPVAEVELLD
jgi:hypothetical protein